MVKVAEKKKSRFAKKTCLQWYEAMLLMRRFEEKANQLYIQQKFGGFCHLYIGQEAVAAGAMTAIEKDDNIITAYRDHVLPLIKGVGSKYIMAELFARITGCSKGKGGSMHMFSRAHRFFGGHGIVGSHIPLGAGIAFAEKYRKTKNVTLCFLGDGAVRQGAYHETLNMAMMWKLPVIFIIENNHYAMGTSVARQSNVTDLYKTGYAYDMPGKPVDGMSCEAVHDAISEAVEHARNGNGPTLLEMKTYRYKGHSMSDPARYRTKEEVEQYKAVDPVEMVLSTIKKNDYASEKELQAIQDKIKAEVDDAVKFAEESPFPEADELYKDVYKQTDYPFIID